MKNGKRKINSNILLLAVTIIAGYLRICNISNPLFSDSAFFGYTIRHNIWSQEQLPHAIVWLMKYSFLSLNPDLQLKLPFLICGILSVPLIYFIVDKNKWFATLFVAFNPLLIFWSGIARPYAMAGLFVILAWRLKYFMIPAILCTPISLISINIKYKKFLIFILVLGIIFYLVRPDIHYNGWNKNLWSIFQSASRWWYLPMISFALYMSDYLIPFFKEMLWEKNVVYSIVIVFSLLFLHWDITIIENKTFTNELRDYLPAMDKYWYRQDVKFNNYKDCGKLDFATDRWDASWYGNQFTRYFAEPEYKSIDSALNKNPIFIGFGKMATSFGKSAILKYLGNNFYQEYGRNFYFGEFMKVKLWKYNNKYYYMRVK